MLLSAAAVAGMAACSSNSGSGNTTAANGKVDTTAVKMAYDSAPDIGDLPSLVAMQMMRNQGYNINPLTLNGSSVTADAVSTGSAQIASLNGISVFQAVDKGNSFVAFAEKYTNEEALVAKSSIKSVANLNGATVSVQSPNATSASLVLYTEKSNNIHLNMVYQPNSATRAAALVSGQIDASPLELDDVDKIIGETHNSYHVLIYYNKSLPWVLGNIFFTSKSIMSAHKSIVQAFTTDLAAADKAAYADPNGYISKYGNLLSGYTPDVLKASMDESASGDIWGINGQIKPGDVQKTLQFDQLDGLLTAAQVQKLQGTESSWIANLAPASP